jgi:hypothetical protein
MWADGTRSVPATFLGTVIDSPVLTVCHWHRDGRDAEQEPQMKMERQMATKKTTSTKKTVKASSAKAEAPKAKKANPQMVEVVPAEAKAKAKKHPRRPA